MRTNKRVSAVIIKDGKILLIHRFKNGSEYWVVPGGGVEDGESLEESLDREVREETSLELTSFELMGKNEESGRFHHFYRCELTEGEPKIGGPELNDSSEDNVYILEWVEVDKLEKINVYPMQIKSYLDKVK